MNRTQQRDKDGKLVGCAKPPKPASPKTPEGGGAGKKKTGGGNGRRR